MKLFSVFSVAHRASPGRTGSVQAWTEPLPATDLAWPRYEHG